MTDVKISIGCRVTPEKKEELTQKALENGFQSFSQYLEALILKASELPNNVLFGDAQISDNAGGGLSDADLDKIEVRLATIMGEKQLEKPTPLKQEIDIFLEKLAIINGIDKSDAEGIETFQEFFKGDFTLDEMFDFLCIDDVIRDRMKNDPFYNLPETTRSLFLEFSNYLIENKHAVTFEGVMVGLPIFFLEKGKGGIFFHSKEVTNLYLEKFELANEKVIEKYNKQQKESNEPSDEQSE